MRVRWSLGCAAVISALLQLQPCSAAQPQLASGQIEARKRFEQGVILFDQKRLADALAEFEACYALYPFYGTLYNIGQVQGGLGRAPDAIRSLEKYLADGGSAISAAQRALVESELAAQRARVGELVVRVEPADATLRVDGVLVGVNAGSAEQVVLAGVRRLEVALDGYRTLRAEAEVSPGARRSLSLTLEPLSVAPAKGAAPLPAASAPTTDALARLRTVAYVLGASGVAAAGVGLGVALAGQAKHRDALREEDSGSLPRAYQLESDSVRQKAFGYALIGAGGVALAAGAAMFVVALPTRPREATASALSCSPWLFPGSAGAHVQGRF